MSHFTRSRINTVLASLVLAGSAFAATAADSTKDIVLDRVMAPATSVNQAANSATDAMAVSVLLESPDGTLTPKSTDTLFHTGDRFRIKVSASRDAKLSIYNTTPRGELKPDPIWQGNVAVGQETITPRFALTADSGGGTEFLHFVMEPTTVRTGVLAWLITWFDSNKVGANKAAGSKDVRLDVESTPLATYSINPNGQGLVNSIRIVHR